MHMYVFIHVCTYVIDDILQLDGMKRLYIYA